jgi:hypothetical protein
MSYQKSVWSIVFILFLIVYGMSCQRSIGWQDSGEFQLRALDCDLRGKKALALAHPLYVLLASLVARLPIGGFPARVTFLSAIGMALTLANLGVICVTISRKGWIGVVIPTMLGVTHAAWWLSSVAEVYTWSVAGLSLEIYLLILLLQHSAASRIATAKLFIAIFFINGLGLSIHNFALLPMPVYLLIGTLLALRRQLPLWSLGGAVIAYLIGAALFVFLLIEKCISLGFVVGVTDALVGNYARQVFNTSLALESLKINATLASLSFANFLLPLAVVGLVNFRRLNGMLALAMGLITGIEVTFVVRYSVPDQFTFLLPSMLLIAVFAGVGLDVLSDASPRWRTVAITAVVFSILFPLGLYAMGPSLLEGRVRVQRARDLPFRDEMRYWMVPWKRNEDSAERFAREALYEAAPDGVILADDTSLYPLVVLQRRDKIALGVWLPYDKKVPSYDRDRESFFRIVGDRKIFVVSPVPGYAPAGLLRDARFVRRGVLYEVLFVSGGRGKVVSGGL